MNKCRVSEDELNHDLSLFSPESLPENMPGYGEHEYVEPSGQLLIDNMTLEDWFKEDVSYE